MRTIFTHFGKGCVINTDKVVAIIQPQTASAKLYKTKAAESGRLIDATKGKKTRSVVVLDDGVTVLSTLSYDTLMNRANGKAPQVTQEEKEDEDVEA